MQDWSATRDASAAGIGASDIEAGDPYADLSRYESAIRQGAADPATLGNFGVLAWRLYQFRQGDEVFQRLLQDERADSATLRRVAQCYFQIGRFAQAAQVMRTTVARIAEADAPTLNTLAWTLERDHQTEEARHYAEAALARDKTYGPAVRLLAHLDRRAGELERAERRLTEHLDRFSGDFDWGLRYELAAVRDRLGRYESAWAALSEAKSQLAAQSTDHLRDSYFIRRRQWELVQSVTVADLRRWRQAGQSLAPSKRIAFLTGFPRSGTTLLEQMIASNADAIDTDESGILPSQFIEPLIWKADDAISAIIELRSFTAAQLIAGRHTFYEFTENYLDEAVGDRLLIEKNPLLTPDLPLALRLFPEARLVIALRDPRDVVLSYLFTMVPLNWSSAPAISVLEACQFYADSMRHWLWWRERLEWPWREVRYEQVIAHPVDETKRVAEFLGLSWDASMVDERHRSERKAVRTPTYDDVTKPLYTRAMGRWRHYERQLTPGLRLLEPLLDALGYAD
jgi:tetratricopeptide (TPR) repeat protein